MESDELTQSMEIAEPGFAVETDEQTPQTQASLPKAIVAGVFAAVVGAAVWAGITVAIEFQIGWMAVGVGFLVGYAIKIAGKGSTNAFGVVGAACALGGCLLGNLSTICWFGAQEESVSFVTVMVNVLLQPAIAGKLLAATFTPMDLLFYGIAVYEGYRFSISQDA